MGQVRVIATIPTCKPLLGVACVGGAEAWIYGDNKTITRIDIHGAVRDTVTTTCLYWPGGISVTRERELIYSDFNSRTVNIVRHGKSETLITTPQDWRPGSVSCTRSRDILVHVYKGIDPQRKNKIIRYQGQNIKQEINKDGQGNPFLSLRMEAIHCLCQRTITETSVSLMPMLTPWLCWTRWEESGSDMPAGRSHLILET